MPKQKSHVSSPKSNGKTHRFTKRERPSLARRLLLLAGAGLIFLSPPEARAVNDLEVTVIDGVNDSFASPGEVASPSPGLQLFASGTLEPNYDGTTVNRTFITTISGFPGPVSQAYVTFRLRPIRCTTSNDGFSLMFVDSSGERIGDRWSRRIGTEPGAPGLLPSRWNTTNYPSGVEFHRLDLSQLANADGTTVNLLDDLNTNGFLDVHMQDDSAIDYFELTVVLSEEEEPCGGASNDTCLNREAIDVPTIVSGTAFATASSRDIDYYKVDATGSSALSFSLSASAEMNFSLLNDCREVLSTSLADVGSPAMFVIDLPAGSYAIRLEPTGNSSPCGSAPITYTLTVDTVDLECKTDGFCFFDRNNSCADADPISCPETWCGTIVDTDPKDWYSFSLPGESLTRWRLSSTFQVEANFRDVTSGCDGSIVHTVQGTGFNPVELWLPGGDYALEIGAAAGQNLTCAGNEGQYVLEYLECADHPIDPSITIVSQASGLWDSPATWNPGVPGPENRVIISHDVRMSNGDTAPPARIKELTIENDGKLRPTIETNLNGVGLSIEAERLLVELGGEILGGRGDTFVGGNIEISLVEAIGGSFVNRGRIFGGDGKQGGDVIIHGSATDLTNEPTGRIQAGFPSGNLDVFGGRFLNDGGFMATGAPGASDLRGGVFKIRGATSVENLNGGTIESFGSPTTSGRFRNVFSAFNTAENGTGSTIDCGNTTNRWLCINAQNILLKGTIRARRFCGDPPVLIVSDDADIQGEVIELAAKDAIIFSNLQNQPAISATSAVRMFVAPGGFADLMDLSSGNWISSGGTIDIQSDAVLTPNGLTPGDLMSVPPTIGPGQSYVNLCITPGDGEVPVIPGEVLERLFSVTNCGNSDLTVDVSLADTAGWLQAPLSVSRPLAPGDDLSLIGMFDVPPGEMPGSSTTVTLTVDPQLGPGSVETTTLLLSVPIESLVRACQGIDGENVLTINGDTGIGNDNVVFVDAGGPIEFRITQPSGGGNGKFVAHLNPGVPTVTTITALPAKLGFFCFPLLINQGSNPEAIWNSIGQPDKIGASRYFGSPIPDPGVAETVFLDLPNGDPVNLAPGTVWTLQAAIINPNASANKPASVTNAIVLVIRP